MKKKYFFLEKENKNNFICEKMKKTIHFLKKGEEKTI